MTIVFVPALTALLYAQEKELGRSLLQEEVEVMRDNATAARFPQEIADDLLRERGYPDLDPENVWVEWLAFREVC